MKSVRGNLAKGTVSISAAGLVTNFLGFISTIILARFLIPSDFGLVALPNSITDLSLNSALVQHRDPTADHFSTAWTLGFLRSLIIALIFCVAAYPVANMAHEPKITSVMFALSIGLVLTGVVIPVRSCAPEI